MNPTFIDLFAGIGGFRIALESLGQECLAYSEIEKHAITVYEDNFDTYSESNLGDITEVFELPEHDLLVGGVPCQSWSIAGKNRGLDDKRGQLWNDVIRLVEQSRPKGFIFENVKGLIDPRHRDCLNSIIESFQSLGYAVEYKLLNSYDFGLAQNRARVFIVGARRDIMTKEFEWPMPTDRHQRLYEIFDKIKKPKKSGGFIPIERDTAGNRINSGFNKLISKGQNNPFFVLTDIRNGPTSIHSWDIYDTTDREKAICMMILKNRRKSRYGECDGNPMSLADLKELLPDLRKPELTKLIKLNILRQYDDGKYEFFNRRLSSGIDGVCRIYLPDCTFFSTLTATGSKDFVATRGVSDSSPENYRQTFVREILQPKKFRAITDTEAVALQGFPSSFTKHSSATQTKRLLGNAVSPPVVVAVAQQLVQTGVFSGEMTLA